MEPSRPLDSYVQEHSSSCLAALTPSHVNPQTASPEMMSTLRAVREKCVIGTVGGSDFPKQEEQLGIDGVSGKSKKRTKPPLTDGS